MTVAVASERNRALLDWYAGHRRSLPWRNVDDPYLVLVSEVMLQQTQAARVVPYYERFVARFPSAETLAAAPLSEVIAEWSGLGYNMRAKRLHDAAKMVVEAGWPRTVADLERLPGVGAYTAQAVAALAYGQPVPAIDTNVRRVLSRWHGEILDPKALSHAAKAAMAEADPGDWNQAVMDLGAGVCKPRRPACGECPVSAWCAGPGTYEPPRPQSKFEGSVRQVRGAVMRALIGGDRDFAVLVEATGFSPDRVADAIGGLVDDELIEVKEDGYGIP